MIDTAHWPGRPQQGSRSLVGLRSTGLLVVVLFCASAACEKLLRHQSAMLFISSGARWHLHTAALAQTFDSCDRHALSRSAGPLKAQGKGNGDCDMDCSPASSEVVCLWVCRVPGVAGCCLLQLFLVSSS